MIAAAIIIVGSVLIVVGPFALGSWAVREHHTAKKYRDLMRQLEHHRALHPEGSGSGPLWTVTYKMNGKVRSRQFPGSSEAEVTREVIKNGSIPLQRIVSITKD